MSGLLLTYKKQLNLMSFSKEDQFINLINNHAGIIHKVLLLYVDHEENKKDLRQEILFQAWKSYQKFEGRSSFSTWLYKVAFNTVLTFKRKDKKTVELVKANTISIDSEKMNDDKAALIQHIRQLNKIDRILISLHLEGYKNFEIAEITGMTQNHVNVKIFRLKKQIISSLKTEEYGHL